MKRLVTMKSLFLILVLSLSMTLMGCSSTSSSSESQEKDQKTEKTTETTSKLEEIKEKGKIVIATGNYYPFEFIDPDTQKLVGYDIDLGEKIGKELGVDVDWKEMQFQALVPSLQNDQADLVIAAMYITDERKKVVEFADPYLGTGMVLVKRKEDTSINSVEDLNGKVVGVKAGATSEKLAQDLKAKGTNIEIKSYKETVDYLKDLELGRVDAAFNDYLNQLGYFQSQPNDSKLEIVGEPLDHSDLGIAANKGNQDLLEVVNKVLADMEASGEKEELFKKWLPEQ